MLTTLHNGMSTLQKHQDNSLHEQHSITSLNLTNTTVVSQVCFVHIHSTLNIQALIWGVRPELLKSSFKSELLSEDWKSKCIWFNVVRECIQLQGKGYKLRQAWKESLALKQAITISSPVLSDEGAGDGSIIGFTFL